MKIQAEFGYDRENAEKILEYQLYKGHQYFFNTLVGAFAWNRLIPFQKEASGSYPIFRKPWLRHSVGFTAFLGASYCAQMMQTHWFPKFSKKYSQTGVTGNTYLNNHDLISKFRFFENGVASADSENEVKNYLELYSSGPLTKATLLDRIAEGQDIDPEYAKKFKIKRRGKDKDDLFWKFGKIHGLEYIAYCSQEELEACGGDPIALQKLINKKMDEPKPEGPGSFDELVSQMHDQLDDYKQSVLTWKGDKEYNPSDLKKMLSLPFYLSKRQELPEPKRGQKEYDLFKEIYGSYWEKFDHL